MRAVRYHDHGEPDVLTVDEIEPPTPDKDEVLIDVAAASVNRIDTLFRAGIDMFQPPLPSVPGSDFAGTVTDVGENVDRFDEGDRVHGATLGGHSFGTYAEQSVAPASKVAHLPDTVSFEEGAAIGHVGVTTWRALVDHADLDPGETCLIHGGSGGVGHIAVQLGAALNASVIGTSSAAARRDRIRNFGATAALDYTASDFRESLEEIAPSGIDVILDGCTDEYLELDLEVLAEGGNVITIEFSTEEDGTAAFSQWHMRLGNWKEATVQFVGAPNAPNVDQILDRLTTLVDGDALDVIIAERYDLEEATQAHRRLMSDQFVGKIVLTP